MKVALTLVQRRRRCTNVKHVKATIIQRLVDNVNSVESDIASEDPPNRHKTLKQC